MVTSPRWEDETGRKVAWCEVKSIKDAHIDRPDQPATAAKTTTVIELPTF